MRFYNKRQNVQKYVTKMQASFYFFKMHAAAYFVRAGCRR